MADSAALAYKEKLDALVSHAGELAPEARRRILRLLDDLNRSILADVSRTAPSNYSAARIQALKAEIDRAIEEFRQQATSQVDQLEQQAWQQAAVSVDAAVAAGTQTVAIPPVLDRAALQIVQGYTADLISGLTRDAGSKINAAIQRAYLGGSNLSQLVDQVGSALNGGEFSGIFSQIGERALSISTNEIMRVHSLSSMARITDLGKRHPDLAKRWLHIPAARVPRISHLLANNQTVAPDKPFLVGGEELMYPRDPSGSAENTINCHCLVIPYLSEEAMKPSDQERDLLRNFGVSVRAA